MTIEPKYKAAKPVIATIVGFITWLVLPRAAASSKEVAMEHARDWMKILENEVESSK